MPTISLSNSVAANAESGNVLAGSPFEFLSARAIVTYAATQAGTAQADISATFQVGGEAVVQGGNVSTRGIDVNFRDDLLARAGGSQGERLFLNYLNTTVGALLVETLVEIQPI